MQKTARKGLWMDGLMDQRANGWTKNTTKAVTNNGVGAATQEPPQHAKGRTNTVTRSRVARN